MLSLLHIWAEVSPGVYKCCFISFVIVAKRHFFCEHFLFLPGADLVTIDQDQRFLTNNFGDEKSWGEIRAQSLHHLQPSSENYTKKIKNELKKGYGWCLP
jgi:hypothetical protein